MRTAFGLGWVLVGLGACAPQAELPRLLATVDVAHAWLVEGGPNPPPTQLLVRNGGTCALTGAAAVTFARSAGWLSVPATFVVGAGGSTALPLTFDPVGVGLSPGTYTASLRLTGRCVPSQREAADVVIAVNLTVQPSSARFDFDAGVVDAGQPDAGPVDAGLSGDGTCAAPFVSAAALPLSVVATTSGSGALMPQCTESTSSGPEHVYRVVLPAPGRLIADVTVLDGGLIPSLDVYADGCEPAGYGIGCGQAGAVREPARAIVRGLDAGVYFVVVDGLLGTAGTYRLDVRHDAAPFDALGTSCATEATLNWVDGGIDLEADTLGALDDGDLELVPGLPCTGYGNSDRNYRVVVPNLGGPVQLTAMAWPLSDGAAKVVLAVLDRCAVDAGVVACPESLGSGMSLPTPARWTATRMPGEALSLWVDTRTGFSSDTSQAFRLRLRAVAERPFQDGACGLSSPQLSPNTSVAGTTSGFASHLGQSGAAYTGVNCPGSTHAGADVAYRYVAPSAGTVRFRVEPERGLDVSIAVLSSCNPASCLAIADGFGNVGLPGTPTEVSVAVTQGQELYVVVDTGTDLVGTSDRGGFVLSAAQ